MSVIRTPDERFAALPDFPYTPHYVDIKGLRVHYIDEGKGESTLCLHGEPSWSFLYRKMIKVLSVRHRVVAMDFIGFGRSDKFTERDAYTFQMHKDALTGFIRALNLERITVVVQDWGGLIGLAVVADMPERFARLVIMNTGLPTGKGKPGEGFLAWRSFVESHPDLPIGQGRRCGRCSYPSAPTTRHLPRCGMPGKYYRNGTSRRWSCFRTRTRLPGVATNFSARLYLRPRSNRRLS
jgi:haloalkane dehalogenase